MCIGVYINRQVEIFKQQQTKQNNNKLRQNGVCVGNVSFLGCKVWARMEALFRAKY